jgi:hypothetical protein
MARSTVEKFTAVTIYILRKYNNLDIFSYASCRRWETSQKPTNAPSWLPNFGLDVKTIEPLIHGVFGPKDSKDLYNAGKQDTATFSLSDDYSCMTVSGLRVDHIFAVEDTFTGQESNEQLFDLYRRVEERSFGIRTRPIQSSLEDFWRALHLDQKDGHRIQIGDHTLAGLDFENKEDCTRIFQKDSIFDLQYCKGRRLLISDQGYLCLGPTKAKIGDIVTAMPGGKVPYLLRKTEEYFMLVGEWYETTL